VDGWRAGCSVPSPGHYIPRDTLLQEGSPTPQELLRTERIGTRDSPRCLSKGTPKNETHVSLGLHMVPEGTELKEEFSGKGGKTDTRAVTVWMPGATSAGFQRTCDPVPSTARPVVVHLQVSQSLPGSLAA
jgi:hypothetical protein